MPAIAALASGRAGFLARIPTEPLRYAGVSVVALAADTAIYLALAWIGVLPAIAGGIGYLIGLALHYVLSVRFVFDAKASRKSDRRLMAEFAASGLAGLALTAAVIGLATSALGLPLLPAKVIAVALSFVVVYFVRRAVVFAAR
jgi:putative flippase GtrA